MALSSYSFGPQTLSYNTTSLILIELLIGLFLYNYSKIGDPVTRTAVICSVNFVLLGIVFAALFFVKFSNAMVLFPGLAFIYLVKLFSTLPYITALRKLFYKIVCFIIGISLFLVLYFKSLNSLSVLLNDYLYSIKAMSNEAYHVTTLLSGYFSSFYSLFEQCITKYALIIGLFVIISFLSLVNVIKEQWKIIFITIYTLAILYLTVFLYLNSYLNGGTFNTNLIVVPYLLFLLLTTLMGFILLFIKSNNKQLIIELMLVGALFFLLPFIGALGTYNNIMIQIIFYMVFWSILIWSALCLIELKINSSIPLVVTSLCLSLIVFNQIYTGIVNYPYRLNGNLLHQNVPVTLNNGGSIFYIDSSLNNLVNTIKTDLNLHTSYSANMPVFSHFEYIGITYLLNGITPSCGWYTGNLTYLNNAVSVDKMELSKRNEMFSTLNCKIIAKTNLELKNKMLFFLSNKQGISAKFTEYLKSININFPTDYKLLNTYQYHINKDTSAIQVFVPNALLK
ncbi:MAG: hypothetical protein H7331_09065 [Bacteroidia bacterium]|nr:hypothetical protein [Bacteroidia bacterium]